MPLSIAMNLPLLLSLLLALGIYLAVASLPVGPERPSLAAWLARHERRPPVDPRATVAPEYRSPLMDGVLGPLLTEAARRAVQLADALSLGQPTRLARRLVLAGHGTPIDHYAQKLGSAAVVAVAGMGLLGLTAPLAAAGRAPALPWWLPLGLAGLGFVLPDLAVERSLRQRRDRLRAELPALLDRLTLHLAAGLSLQAGCDSAVRRGGLLASVLEPVLTGARLGGSPLAAGLHQLGADWEVPELHTLATIVGLGEGQGVTIRAALSKLSEDLRIAERHRLARAGQAATLRQTVPVATVLVLAFVAVLLLPAIDSILALRPR